MLLPVTTLTLVGLLLAFRRWDKPHSGLRLGLWVWLLAVVLTAAPVLVYVTSYRVGTDAFLAASLLALAAGYALVRRPHRVPPSPGHTWVNDITIAWWVGCIGVMGNLLLLASAVRGGVQLSPSFLLQNLDSIRAESFQRGQGPSDPLVTLGNYLSPASFMYLIVFSCATNATRQAKQLAVVSFALIVLVALFFYGGRQPIIVATLLILAARWLRQRPLARVRLRTGLIAIASIIIVWFLATGFVTSRESQSTNPEYLLQKVSRASYPSWLARTARSNSTLGQALFQLSYFSSPLPSFVFYMDAKPTPGPYYGRYSYTLPYTIWAVLGGRRGQEPWLSVRQEVFEPFTVRGYAGNVWATWLRDLYVDFGYLAIAFTLLFGAFMAAARNLYERTGGAFVHALEVYAVTTFAFGAFQSLLYINYVENGFFYCCAIVLVQRIRLRRS